MFGAWQRKGGRKLCPLLAANKAERAETLGYQHRLPKMSPHRRWTLAGRLAETRLIRPGHWLGGDRPRASIHKEMAWSLVRLESGEPALALRLAKDGLGSWTYACCPSCLTAPSCRHQGNAPGKVLARHSMLYHTRAACLSCGGPFNGLSAYGRFISLDP